MTWDRRRLLALPLTAFLLSGSGCNSGPHQIPIVEFEGREYMRLGLADIPTADLRQVGTATLENVTDVTDPTVLAITDVDPAVLIVLRIDPARVEADDAGKPSRAHALLGGPAVDELPEVACRYFDPRDEGTPTDCQVPITLVFDGRRYRALEPFVAKAGPAGLRFSASDLTAAGPLSDIDPRLSLGGLVPVDPNGRTIDGVDPNEAIVIVRGAAGEDEEYLPFIVEGLARMPRSLCRFVDPERETDTTESVPRDCP